MIPIRKRKGELVGRVVEIVLEDIIRSSVPVNPAPFQPDTSLAQGPDGFHIVADEQDRSSALREVTHLSEAFLLERGVPNGENLVDDEDIGFQVCGHGKGKPYIHARGVAFYR